MSEIADRAGRDRAGAVGGVPADGLFRRIDRRHLPPVLGDDRLGDGAVGAGRADPQPGADRQPAQAASTRRRAAPGSHGASRASACAARRRQRRVQHAASTALVDRYVGTRDQGRRPQMAVPRPSMRVHLRRCSPCCSSACRPASCRPRTRARPGPVPPARRRDPEPHARRCSDAIEDYFLTRTKARMSARCSPSPAAAAAAAQRPEYRPGLHQPRRLGRPHGQGKYRRRDRPARAAARSRGLRDAQVFALGPAGDPRPRPVERLHHGAAEHQRHVAATQFAAARDKLLAMASANPRLTAVRLSELPDVADAQGRYRTQRS